MSNGGNREIEHDKSVGSLSAVPSPDPVRSAGQPYTSTLALASLVVGIFSLLTFGLLALPGLILGLEIDRPGTPIVKECLEQGLIINCVQEGVLRFVPPLIVGELEIDRLLRTLDKLL